MEKNVETWLRELDVKLAELFFEYGLQNNKLGRAFCPNSNKLNEAVIEQYGTALAQMLDRFLWNEAEVRTLVAHEKRIEQRVGERDAKLAQLSFKSGCRSNKPAEICHHNVHLKETRRDQCTT